MLADSLPPELYRTICTFNADLLSQSLGGRTMLVQRLAELVRVRGSSSRIGLEGQLSNGGAEPVRVRGSCPMGLEGQLSQSWRQPCWGGTRDSGHPCGPCAHRRV